jgi:hypothetical protein
MPAQESPAGGPFHGDFALSGARSVEKFPDEKERGREITNYGTAMLSRRVSPAGSF